ncbi:uncharacterized protein LOC143481941 isoform X4 [Brachyhypopomus gauderio]|uniref:uncharacterized protein LOC143481941 isoform X4 n=1 Tax=Brachyhypopomus gauderio TaxID=698409 RepID=UPI004040FEFE
MEHNEGNADVIRSTRNLLSLLTSQSGSAAGPSQDNVRSFPGLFTKGWGKKRFSAATTVLCKPAKVMPFIFYLLPRQYDRTPKQQDQLLHTQAGLGHRTAYIDENATYNEANCPICQEEMPLDILEIHASSCKERTPPEDKEGPSTPHTSSGTVTPLACNAEPSNAAQDTCINDFDRQTTHCIVQAVKCEMGMSSDM